MSEVEISQTISVWNITFQKIMLESANRLYTYIARSENF